MSGAARGGDADEVGGFPGAPVSARDRIFGVDEARVRQLLADAELCNLSAWAETFVADLRFWINRGQRVTPKQLRTLEDIVARGR